MFSADQYMRRGGLAKPLVMTIAATALVDSSKEC